MRMSNFWHMAFPDSQTLARCQHRQAERRQHQSVWASLSRREQTGKSDRWTVNKQKTKDNDNESMF